MNTSTLGQSAGLTLQKGVEGERGPAPPPGSTEAVPLTNGRGPLEPPYQPSPESIWTARGRVAPMGWADYNPNGTGMAWIGSMLLPLSIGIIAGFAGGWYLARRG